MFASDTFASEVQGDIVEKQEFAVCRVEANFLLFCLNARINDPQGEELSPVWRSDSRSMCVHKREWAFVSVSACVCTGGGAPILRSFTKLY